MEYRLTGASRAASGDGPARCPQRLDPASDAVLRWWRGIVDGEARLPGRADLRAAELSRLLPNLVVAERGPDGQFSLSSPSGAGCGGGRPLGRRWPAIAEVLEAVVRDGVPVVAREDLDDAGDAVLEVLHVPLASDGRTPDAVLAVFGCDDAAAPLWARPPGAGA